MELFVVADEVVADVSWSFKGCATLFPLSFAVEEVDAFPCDCTLEEAIASLKNFRALDRPRERASLIPRIRCPYDRHSGNSGFRGGGGATGLGGAGTSCLLFLACSLVLQPLYRG